MNTKQTQSNSEENLSKRSSGSNMVLMVVTGVLIYMCAMWYQNVYAAEAPTPTPLLAEQVSEDVEDTDAVEPEAEGMPFLDRLKFAFNSDKSAELEARITSLAAEREAVDAQIQQAGNIMSEAKQAHLEALELQESYESRVSALVTCVNDAVAGG